MKKSLEFYNNFGKKLVNDYVYGNKRIESAITNLGLFIPPNAKNILDVGCGLGWSSYEFSQHFKSANIQGIDLSPTLIDNAKKLFNTNNLTYEVFDITKNLPKKKYDVVVMIDVYEHIPKNDRLGFHNSLKKLLNEQGRLIIACPSKYHQAWLKNNKPKGFQPVDEDVDNEVVLHLANDIDGEVIFFEYQNIWQNLDYFYAVIEINPIYGSNTAIKNEDKIVLENKDSRIRRVKTNLGIDVCITKNKNIFLNKLKKLIRF